MLLLIDGGCCFSFDFLEIAPIFLRLDLLFLDNLGLLVKVNFIFVNSECTQMVRFTHNHTPIRHSCYKVCGSRNSFIPTGRFLPRLPDPPERLQLAFLASLRHKLLVVGIRDSVVFVNSNKSLLVPFDVLSVDVLLKVFDLFLLHFVRFLNLLFVILLLFLHILNLFHLLLHCLSLSLRCVVSFLQI